VLLRLTCTCWSGRPLPRRRLNLTATVARDPEQITGHRVAPQPPLFLQPQVVKAIKERGSNLWDGYTFSLQAAKVDGQGFVESFDAYLGSYFDMVNSAGYLEYELLTSVYEGSFRPKTRETILSQFQTPRECLLSGGGVDGTIGISTLVVYPHGGEYYMLCEVRSGKVAEYSDLYHVAPSFIFQPVVSPTAEHLQVEFSVEHNVFREYLEELFDVEEVAASGGRSIRPTFMDTQISSISKSYLPWAAPS
jgi:hypothetical protein